MQILDKPKFSYTLLLLFGLWSCCSWTQTHAATTDTNNDAAVEKEAKRIKVFTVATERTDGYLRYLRSAKRIYDIEVNTLGMDEEWKGGDMNGLGGGYKIRLLREAVKPFKDEKDAIILFTDSYDVVFTADLKEIYQKFKEFGAKVLFSAEKFCWPDEKLASKYPPVSEANASPYLNSGAFIGYAPEVYSILSDAAIKDDDDDQRYYTKIFLDTEKRKKLGIQLDTQSRLFQNLNGAREDVKLNVDLDSNEGKLQNINFMTEPSIIHGNGPSKMELNAFANYLAKTFKGDCLICQENRLELDENNLPVISLALVIAQAVPFFDMFLQKIEDLNYPKEKLHLYIYSNQKFHDDMAKSFLKRLEHEYRSAKIVLSNDELNEQRGRELALQQAKQKQCDYIFFVDAAVQVDDPQMLRELLIMNRQFVAPVVSKYDELWSNFWGALSDGGYYARSHDYVDIVKGSFTGMWNVPYVSSVYLIKSSAFKYISYQHRDYDPDMAMCESLRKAGVFMYVTNLHVYGHLVNADGFDTAVARPDFYTLFSNKYDWVRKYIHPNYFKHLEPNTTVEQPCPDVFWFQVGTDAFCDDLVAIVENFGKWSDGSNKDSRLEGGYEAVPTRDIHMKQVGLDPLWLKFLDFIVRPLQEKAFLGYYHNPPRSLMNFVVRYRPDEQPSLRPHHDSSTYTINIALNSVDVDYEGGGCRFLRYNCQVDKTRKGWMFMHPGRLTHYHEGLSVTNGTRYIMISFVDP
ncbi:PREDICTED: procollagen-lysine,2-oxoglutarate 5-dioxygenase 1 [Rhagoletis zephyria]|uniref:procollagen-lysine,2-oxoglutarate 5-dioxygenase 1 n=1 Tax=Rhagoletis zephyria TaxID=28612 RepID=UPI00081182A2|nr:PREDICTED: procollagen-lysine,2-oxoglutarate 5-dioxygenase 1 [Rhagoletis zephyria]